MPFLDSDVRSANFTTLGLTPFEDPDGLLSLSNSQKPHFYKFARPSEIGSRHSKHVCMYQVRRDAKGRANDLSVSPPLHPSQNISPYTIKQTLVTDCSFIASLCISAAYERRFRKRLVTAIIYPQTSQGKPVYNECGKYIVKLWLNGVARRVVIDDRLPVDRNYNLLCSHTKSSTHLELWVSLLEKAFLKLTGAMSYAFPGSNSGIDLYCLTGWIPERLFFAGSAGVPGEHETKPEKIWQVRVCPDTPKKLHPPPPPNATIRFTHRRGCTARFLTATA
jgi:calpain-7